MAILKFHFNMYWVIFWAFHYTIINISQVVMMSFHKGYLFQLQFLNLILPFYNFDYGVDLYILKTDWLNCYLGLKTIAVRSS